MKSRRFLVAIIAMILVFILGIMGNDAAVMAISTIAVGIAGAAAADTFSEHKFKQQNKEIPPCPKAIDEEDE